MSARAGARRSVGAAMEVVYDRSDGCRFGFGAMELGASLSWCSHSDPFLEAPLVPGTASKAK